MPTLPRRSGSSSVSVSMSALALALLLAAPTRAHAGAPSCPAAPQTGCRTSQAGAQTRLWMNNQGVNRRDNVVWKLRRSAASTVADFGDPVHSHGYALCMYGPTGALVFHATLPSGGTCGGRECWRTAASGYNYRSGAAMPDGLTKVHLRSGPSGHSSVVVKGRGTHLTLPSMPVALPLTIQLQEESGPCWASTFTTARVNDGAHFRATVH